MFSHKYFMAWIKVAERNPTVLFYAYTKSLTYWVRSRNLVPGNLVLTASYGGRDDHLIAEHGLRSAKVVFSVAEAEKLGLEIDHDDSHACDPTKANQDFALLIHGVQPKGSKAAEVKDSQEGRGDSMKAYVASGNFKKVINSDLGKKI